MHQLVEATHRVSKLLGNFACGKSLDEIGPQRFVLPMIGILGREKGRGGMGVVYEAEQIRCAVALL